jgi:hypothetical protein
MTEGPLQSPQEFDCTEMQRERQERHGREERVEMVKSGETKPKCPRGLAM